MGKREKHNEDLQEIFDDFIKTHEYGMIREYLMFHSALPGRRANIELGLVFGDVCQERLSEDEDEIWKLCCDFIELSAQDAPVNDPKEFIPYCGTIAIGKIGSAVERYSVDALAHLRKMANDSRWRIREAVAMGIEAMLDTKPSLTLDILEQWIGEHNWLEMRAAAAGVAQPPLLLRYKDIAKKALEFHQTICQKIHENLDGKSDEFLALRKGLGFTLSIVVCAQPTEGFQLMRELIRTGDSNLKWIVKENLKKKRLLDTSSEQTKELSKLV